MSVHEAGRGAERVWIDSSVEKQERKRGIRHAKLRVPYTHQDILWQEPD
jgi:hypothetical protein